MIAAAAQGMSAAFLALGGFGRALLTAPHLASGASAGAGAMVVDHDGRTKGIASAGAAAVMRRQTEDEQETAAPKKRPYKKRVVEIPASPDVHV